MLEVKVEEMIAYIVEKTGLDEEVVAKVVDAEGDYYVSIGIAEYVEEGEEKDQ